MRNLLFTLGLLVLAGCAPRFALPATLGTSDAPVIRVPALPVLPEGAVQIRAVPVACPGVIGLAKGYDTNGNGDFEIAELWRGDQRIAILYYDQFTEQEITHGYVQEGSKVMRYTRDALFARYPSVCAILLAHQPV